MIQYLRSKDFLKKIEEKEFRILLLLFLYIPTGFLAHAQTITVNADDTRHIFEGAGVSIGPYHNDHWDMNATNRDLAIQYISKDLNMVYLQDYSKYYPLDDPEYFDRRANYFKESKVYRPEGKISLVFQRFPAHLTVDPLVDRSDLDVSISGIYDSLANWYYQTLLGYKLRGVDIDIINVVNEPDFNKSNRYGYNDAKMGVSFILKEAIPKLKAILNDPAVNTEGIGVPLIMAPSTLAVQGCINYVNYWKSNYPDAWAQVDIVGTHQYNQSTNEAKFVELRNLLEGRLLFQTEQHGDHSDYLNLGTAIPREHRTILGLAALFATAVNNGVHSWYYFSNNYPNAWHPGGLIRVEKTGAFPPERFKHYHTFKQLTSTQPINSNVITTSLSTDFDSKEVIAFRKNGDSTVYLNLSNFGSSPRNVTINVANNIGSSYDIKGVVGYTTDGTVNYQESVNTIFSTPQSQITFNMGAYSTNVLSISIDPNSATGGSGGTLTNVALNKTASGTKTKAGYSPAAAVDGDKVSNNSRWVTDGSGYPYTLDVDLGGDYEVSGLNLYTGYNTYKKPITQFSFQVWNGTNWVEHHSESNNNNSEYTSTFTPIVTSQVRLIAQAGQDNTVRLFEMEVLGEAASTGPTVPSTPSNLTASAVSTSQIDLNWTDNSSDEDNFTIEQSTDGVNFSVITPSLSANTTSFSATGLVANTSYSFRVSASNTAGSSDFSNISNATTLKNPPASPSGLAYTNVTNNSLDLNWSDNSTNEEGFYIEQATAGGTYVQIASLEVNSSSYGVTGLSGAVSYSFRIQAHNNGGNSAYSNVVTVQTVMDPPSAPDMLTVSNTSSSSLELSWNDNSTDETGFKIEQSNSGGGFVEIASLGANTVNYSISGLTPNTNYSYRVLAYNDGGNSVYSNTVSETTLKTPPSAPSGLTISNLTSSSLDLNWTDNSTNEDGFYVEQSEAGGAYSQIADVTSNSNNLSITNLSPSTSYSFRVRGYNNGGSSAYSNTATGTTLENTGCQDCIDFNTTTTVSFSNQDGSANVQIQDAGLTLRLADNTWRRTSNTYAITSNTVVEFEYMSTSVGEIQGIGFDENNSISSGRMFKLQGTQNWGLTNYTYTTSGTYQSFTIPVGTHYTGTSMYLVFMNDQDQGTGSNSHFRNVRIYESGGARIPIDSDWTQSEPVDLKIYPMPANDFLNIVGPEKGQRISIRTIDGDLIWNKTLTNHKIDISNLNPGLYLVYVNENVVKLIKE